MNRNCKEWWSRNSLRDHDCVVKKQIAKEIKESSLAGALGPGPKETELRAQAWKGPK